MKKLFLCALLFLPSAAGSLYGQDAKIFRVEELNGWEEAYFEDTEFERLYDFKKYERWDGKLVPMKVYKDLHNEWSAHRSAVQRG